MDDEYHAAWHEEYVQGPLLPVVSSLPTIETLDEFRVLVADRSVTREKRRELAHVARVAQRSMQSYPIGYDGTITEDDERLFMLATGDRVPAMVLTGNDDFFWKFHWLPDGSVELVDHEAVKGQRLKIARVWVAKAHRARGLGRRLVQAAVRLLGTDLASIGWELPLSKDGRRLVRTLAPGRWLGHGGPLGVGATVGHGEDRH